MSEVSICNIALSYIRAGGINSLTETSAQAQQCSLHYVQTRDEVLVAAPWGFAHRIDTLALLTATVFNWAYLYAYPADCMHINKLVLNYSAVSAGSGAYRPRAIEDIYMPDLGAEIPYQIVNVGGVKAIATNFPDLHIDYQLNITDTTLFDINTREAISRLLASKLAIPLVGGKVGLEYEKAQFTKFTQVVAEAVADNMNERYTTQPDSEFTTARR